MTATSESIEQQDTANEVEFKRAYNLAKSALTHIGNFRTPPTPSVYEVWYTFSQGDNPEIQSQLDHAVNVAKSVSSEQLEQLRLQFLDNSNSTEVGQQVGETMSAELASLQELIQSQQAANADFSDSIATANDSLTGELSPSDIKACVQSLMESNSRMQNQMDGMSEKLDQSQNLVNSLQSELYEAQRSMYTDPLTGIGNRRFFDRQLAMVLENVQQKQAHCYLILVDIDKFKTVNDTLGHAAGDEAIQFVASSLQEKCKAYATARFGGDEFAMLVESDSIEEVTDLVEDIRLHIARTNIEVSSTGDVIDYVTLSIGGARIREEDSSESVFERADRMLYAAKSSGRNNSKIEHNFLA